MGMESIHGVSELFIRRDSQGNISFMLAKITDDVLFTESSEHLRQFIERMKLRLDVSKAITCGPLKFNGCNIVQDKDGNITMSMGEYMKQVQPMTISRELRKQPDGKATEVEYHDYRSLSGAVV